MLNGKYVVVMALWIASWLYGSRLYQMFIPRIRTNAGDLNICHTHRGCILDAPPNYLMLAPPQVFFRDWWRPESHPFGHAYLKSHRLLSGNWKNGLPMSAIAGPHSFP
jgi:hypothetical protein